MMIRQAAILLLTSTTLGLAQSPPVTVLQVELTNYVNYYVDVADPLRIGSSPGVTPLPAGFNSTFKTQIGVGDIASINGEPAKGIWIFRALALNLSLTPAPGRAIADLGRVAAYDLFADVLQQDGTHIGIITGGGLGGGMPPPGAPTAAAASNLSITGGTGAFLGARGQTAVTGGANLRAASAAEDPANRRLNGGGVLRMIVHLIPMTTPEVLTLAAGPAIFHASDFSPVTANRPARAGEMLIAGVSGLGPVRPNLGPGAPFPPFEQGNLHQVNSPVSVSVNGQKAAVVNKAGWPTLHNVYRVDFVVPDGTAPGMATLALSVAWINGPEVKFPVQ
jgi:uncharacterized protein (TIGR03437 family)